MENIKKVIYSWWFEYFGSVWFVASFGKKWSVLNECLAPHVATAQGYQDWKKVPLSGLLDE